MKKYILSVFILLASSITHAKEFPLEGVWTLVSAQHQYQSNGPVININKSPTLKSYKIITDGHYAVLTQDASKNIFGVNMGTYSVDDNVYTENFIIHSDTSKINKKAIFTFKLKNDKWYIYSDDIVEIWQKVERPQK